MKYLKQLFCRHVWIDDYIVTDYSVLVERFYDDYYTVGTAMFPYNTKGEADGQTGDND